MKIKKYFSQITIIILLQLLLLFDLTWAQPETMLSPSIEINRLGFKNALNRTIRQPFIDPSVSLAERITQTRQAYAKLGNNKNNLSSWPKFYLKHVLNPTTAVLAKKMITLIHWMNSVGFSGMNSIQQLGYIENLANDLTPFEKILFYEGVYFVWPQSNDLGFNIKTTQYKNTNYFYNKELFAHGSFDILSDAIELSFGDDLIRQNLPPIKHVKFYCCMKKISDIYVQHPGKKLVITNNQLINLAMVLNPFIFAQTLNFYLSKVKGFKPDYQPKTEYKKAMQKEYLSQLKHGFHLTYQDAEKIVSHLNLSRDLSLEEKYYQAAIQIQSNKAPKTKQTPAEYPRTTSTLSLVALKARSQAFLQRQTVIGEAI